MPICSNCKNEVPDDADFCSKCGTKINTLDIDEPIENTNETSDNNSDGADVPFETKFCSNCGEKVSINAVACPKCGAGLTRTNNVQQQVNTKKKSNANKSNKKSTTGNKKRNKTNNKQNKQNNGYKNNSRKCSNCGSQYGENDVFCDQCGHKIHRKKDNDGETAGIVCVGVIVVGIGILFLSLCWPFGIIYFYLLYKYLSS